MSTDKLDVCIERMRAKANDSGGNVASHADLAEALEAVREAVSKPVPAYTAAATSTFVPPTMTPEAQAAPTADSEPAKPAAEEEPAPAPQPVPAEPKED
ncbi:MAG: hypothetical protein AAGD08_15965 [Pseudomonadota bacterium]